MGLYLFEGREKKKNDRDRETTPIPHIPVAHFPMGKARATNSILISHAPTRVQAFQPLSTASPRALAQSLMTWSVWDSNWHSNMGC